MKVSKSVGVIQLAINYIKNDNIKGLEKVLDIMPLDKLKGQAESLLSVFLAAAAANGRTKALKPVLEAWSVIYPDTENIQLLSKLFMMNEINLPTLAFVTLSHEDYTYVELMDDLMSADNSPDVVTACSKADQIFGPQPYETYVIVKDHAEEMENYIVEEYAIANMEEHAPYQEVPKWVKNYTDNPITKESEMYIPETGEIPFAIPPDEEAVELMTAGLSQLGLSLGDIDRAKDHLLKTLAVSTRAEKIEMMRPIMENQAQQILGGDKWFFRVFGPANPLVNQDLTLPGKSNKYGGCRMFLCDVFDYDEEFDYVADWFRGACDTCHLRIKQRWHAVRRPRPHGGWEGCYCSWKCARESIYENSSEPDLLTHELISEFERQTKEIGIQDRLADNKE